MAIYCPDLPTLLSIDGGAYVEYPPGTDISAQALSATYSLLFWRNNYNASAGGWNPNYYQQALMAYGTSGLLRVAGTDAMSFQSASDLLATVSNEKKKEIVEKATPGGGWSWVRNYDYYPPNGCPLHGAHTVYFNGNNAFGYNPGFSAISTISLTIAYKKLTITTPP